jgi:hemerythrin-like domain-containing protein
VTAEASAIGAFLAQHESGRLLVREMLGALAGVNRGEKAACQAFSASAVEYVALLRQHIRLEDQHFAEYAEEYLSPEEDAALRERMDAVDRDRASDAGTDRFHQMVAEYEKALLQC